MGIIGGETGIEAGMLLAFVTLLTLGLMFLVNHLLSDLDRYYEKLDECELQLENIQEKKDLIAQNIINSTQIPKKISILMKNIKTGLFAVSFGIISIFVLVIWFFIWITGILILCDDLTQFWWIPIPIVLILTYFCNEYLDYIKNLFNRYQIIRRELIKKFKPSKSDIKEILNLNKFDYNILVDWKKFWSIFIIWGIFTIIFLLVGLIEPFFNWMGLLSFSYASLVPVLSIEAGNKGTQKKKRSKNNKASNIPAKFPESWYPLIFWISYFFVFFIVLVELGIDSDNLNVYEWNKWIGVILVSIINLIILFRNFSKKEKKRFITSSMCIYLAIILPLILFIERDYLFNPYVGFSHLWLILIAALGFFLIIGGFSYYFYETNRYKEQFSKNSPDTPSPGSEGATPTKPNPDKKGYFSIITRFIFIKEQSSKNSPDTPSLRSESATPIKPNPNKKGYFSIIAGFIFILVVCILYAFNNYFNLLNCIEYSLDYFIGNVILLIFTLGIFPVILLYYSQDSPSK